MLMFGLTMIITSDNLAYYHRYNLGYFIFLTTYVVFAFFYVALCQNTNGDWRYIEFRLQSLLPCVLISWALHNFSIHFTLPPMKMTTETETERETERETELTWNSDLEKNVVLQTNQQDLADHYKYVNVTEISLSDSKKENNFTSPSDIAMLTCIIVFALVFLLFSLYKIYCHGRVIVYLVFYTLFFTFLGLLTLAFQQAPFELNLHIHHYFLGIALWPLTLFKNRFSMLCQGVLLGIYINGIVRWGHASMW
eukprot:Pgem_evm1s70